jgi:hypothetical protein
MGVPDVVGQRLDGSPAPPVGGDPSTDGRADLPVQVDEFLVDGGDRAGTRCFNHTT